MRYLFSVMCLGLGGSLFSITKYCGVKDLDNIHQKLGLQFVKESIYRVPQVLRIDAAKAVEYTTNKLYQDGTKKYKLALKKGLMPDLCIKWINKTVGYGLFANEAIQKGQLLGEYVGVIDFASNVKNTDFAFVYPLKIDGKQLSLDCRHYSNALRFANHSDQSNTNTQYIVVDGRFRLIFFARVDIKAGQQIFINYGANYWWTDDKANVGRKKLNLGE